MPKMDYIVTMVKEEKKRDPASEALIELRKAMGKTQQTFAVEVLKTAIGTIARYETSEPPRGEALLRLRDIAGNHGFRELHRRFDAIYMDQEQKKLRSTLTMVPATEGKPARGYLNLALIGDFAIGSAQAFMKVLDLLKHPSKEVQKDAVAALEALRDTWEKHTDPKIVGAHDFFRSIGAGVPHTAKKTKRSR